MSVASDAAREAERARTGKIVLWAPPAPGELDAFPLTGDCQKCRKAVDLKQGEHRCGG